MDNDGWLAETVFSSLKRVLEDFIHTIKMEDFMQELLLIASLINNYIPI
jgi:hypothetical protein